MHTETTPYCELNLRLSGDTYAELRATAQQQGRHAEDLAHDLLLAAAHAASHRPAAMPQWPDLAA